MQAGEKLDFVRPFDGVLPEQKAIDTTDSDATDAFNALCTKLIEKYVGSVKDTEIFQNGEYLTVFELTLRVPADDGSYLHVVVFGHAVDSGVIDFAINVTEHDNDGVFHGGYLYTYDVDGFSRQKVTAESTDEFDDPDRTHFSLIQLYRSIDELQELQQADDMEIRMMAIETLGTLEENAEFETWSIEMGYDGQKPTPSEIDDLATLLDFAAPYTPPSQEHDEL